MIKKNQYLKNNSKYLKKNIVVKDYFKEIKKILMQEYKNKKISLIDVACASGDFLYFIKSIKNFELSGIDYSQKLLKLAKHKNNNIKFKRIDITKKNYFKEKFDVVTCLGTMTVFDDLKMPINNLFKLCKDNGLIILYDPINIYNIDTILRYKKEKKWLSGFNLFSKKTIINNFKEINKKCRIRFTKFILKTNLKMNKDKMNAWTTKIDNKKRIMVGTSQVLDFHIIKIKNVR